MPSACRSLRRAPLAATAWLLIASAAALSLAMQIGPRFAQVSALALSGLGFAMVIASIGTLRAATGRRGVGLRRALGLPLQDYVFAAVFASLSGYGIAIWS